MQYLDRISAIEQRAGKLNISVHRLCGVAGVEYSSVTRWRKGGTGPLLRRFEETMGALEATLDRLEREMFERLAPKFKGEHRPAA